MISSHGARMFEDFLRDHRDKAKLLRDNKQKEIDALTKEGKTQEALGVIAQYQLFEGMYQAYDDALFQLKGWNTDD